MWIGLSSARLIAKKWTGAKAMSYLALILLRLPKVLVFPSYMVAGWSDRCTGYNHKAHPYSAFRYPLVSFPVRCFKQLPCIFVVRLGWFHTWERRQVQRDLSWRV